MRGRRRPATLRQAALEECAIWTFASPAEGGEDEEPLLEEQRAEELQEWQLEEKLRIGLRNRWSHFFPFPSFHFSSILPRPLTFSSLRIAGLLSLLEFISPILDYLGRSGRESHSAAA